jgi:multiple sugar transport system substrate-binding protein
VGVAMLPSFPGHKSAATLGGWQIGINRYSKNREAAKRFVRFLTAHDAQKNLALTVGFLPARKSLYQDNDLIKNQPFMKILYDVFAHAKPRPVTPFYMMITHHLQSEFSAIVSGIKSPEKALRDASDKIAFILRNVH